jgi:transcriptional regulator with XRE-family HTH domain
MALRFLRQSSNLTIPELQELTGFTTLQAWEIARCPVTRNKLGDLLRSLPLSVGEAKLFAVLVNPEITSYVGEKWLEQKIGQKDWETLSFPALDEIWLTVQQPPEIRAGLFLRDLLLSKGLGKRQISENRDSTYYALRLEVRS